MHESVSSKFGSFITPAKVGEEPLNFKKTVLIYDKPRVVKKAQSFGKLDFANLGNTQTQSFRKLDYGSCMDVLKNSQRYRKAFADHI